MKHIASKNTLSRAVPRILLALALFLGTFAVTRVSNAQSASPTLVSALQAATGSTSTSGTYLLSIATSAQLSQAVLQESGSFTAASIPVTTETNDVAFILNYLPTAVTTAKGKVPAPSDANFYPTLITDLFGGTGVTAISPSVLTASGGVNSYDLAYVISSNTKLLGAIGGDAGQLDLAYFEGIALDQNGAPTAIAQAAAAVAANLTATGTTLTAEQNNVGVYAEYYAAIPGKTTADDHPGIIPLVANAVAFQPVGTNYIPTPSGEAAIAAGVGLGAVTTGTYVENTTLSTAGVSGSAGAIAAAYATHFVVYTGQIAEEAVIDYPSAAPAIGYDVTVVEPAEATYTATDEMAGLGQTNGVIYGPAVTGSIDAVSTLVDTTRETVAQDVIAAAPSVAPSITGSAAVTLTTDVGKYFLSYVVADQLGGLEAVNGVTLPISDITEIPAATEAVQASIQNSDSAQASTSTTVTEYAAFPIWEAEYGYKKVAANPAYAFISGSFYAAIALDAAMASNSNGILSPAIQAADAAGVAELFGPTNSIAILTATTVEQNALTESTTSTAPKTAYTFASNAVLGPDAQYLAAQGAIQYASSPTDVALISGSVAQAQPTYAPVTGFQVAVVTATSNYVAVADAIATAPGVTELSREVLAQDIIDANPTADAAGHIDALVAGAVGTILTSDADRAALVFLIADEEAGVDGYFTPPTGGSVLSIPQNVAAVTGALASDETATGATLITDEQTLAIDSAYVLSPLDTGKHGNTNPGPDEPYIPAIVNAVIASQPGGNYLGIAGEATINGALVGAFGTELSGSIGTEIIGLDVPTTLSQNPTGSAPTTAYDYAYDLAGSALTYANPIATAVATGQNPYLSGSIGAAVDGAVQFVKNFSTGSVAQSVALAASPFTAGVQSFESDATLAQTELNDTAAYVARGFAANTTTSLATVSGTYQFYVAYLPSVSGSLAALVSGTSNRAGAGIASTLTNKISTFTYSTTLLTYVEQVAAAAATHDPEGSGDIFGYVIASLETQNNTNPTPYSSSTTWATNLAAIELGVKNALLASAVGLNAAQQAAVTTAYTDISSATANAVKSAYLAGDYGPQYDGVITFNETPVVDD
jgi:hypothetical protein